VALGVLLLMPKDIFNGLLFVLGFFGWVRIVIALFILAGYIAYRYIAHQMAPYSTAYARAVAHFTDPPKDAADKDDDAVVFDDLWS
jgi:hypothetical protein